MSSAEDSAGEVVHRLIDSRRQARARQPRGVPNDPDINFERPRRGTVNHNNGQIGLPRNVLKRWGGPGTPLTTFMLDGCFAVMPTDRAKIWTSVVSEKIPRVGGDQVVVAQPWRESWPSLHVDGIDLGHVYVVAPAKDREWIRALRWGYDEPSEE